MASVAPADDGPRRVVIGTSKALGLGEQYRNYVRQSWIEVSRNKCQFCLGCCSICLVVFVVCIALTTLSYAPILLLGLAEANTGEIDLELVPPGSRTCGTNANECDTHGLLFMQPSMASTTRSSTRSSAPTGHQ